MNVNLTEAKAKATLRGEAEARHLVLGYPGQDARLLRANLRASGEKVLVAGRRPTNQTDFLVDVRDIEAFREVLRVSRPTHIYFLTALHEPSVSRGEGEHSSGRDEYHRVNVHPVIEILDYLANHFSPRAFFAGSSLTFAPSSGHISEDSTRVQNSLYAESKLLAEQYIEKYRSEYGVYACVGHLFNHESEFRRPGFISREIILHLLRKYEGRVSKLTIQNPAARVDWGDARNFVDGFVRVLKRDQPDDFVFASGESHSVGEFFNVAAAHLGIDSRVEEKPSLEEVSRLGNPSRIHSALNWRARERFDAFVAMLLTNWQKRLVSGLVE